MKIFKNYLVYPFVSAGLLALAFLYNIIFALSVSADPVLSYGILFYFLPLLIGMYLVHYGIKNNNRIIIYIGHIFNIISSLFITIKIERIVFAWMSDFPGIILLIFSIWPLLLLLISLTIKAFCKDNWIWKTTQNHFINKFYWSNRQCFISFSIANCISGNVWRSVSFLCAFASFLCIYLANLCYGATVIYKRSGGN